MSIIRRKINLINNLFSGIIIILLGLTITIGSVTIYTKIINLLTYSFLIFALSKLISFILNRKIVKNKQVLIGIMLNILFAISLLIFPLVSLSILPFCFSLYLLLHSIVKFIDYIILRGNSLIDRFKSLFFSIIFLLLSLTLLLSPLQKLNVFILIVGMYCIFLGLNRIYDFVIDLLSDKFELKIKKKIKVTLPLIFEAFLPVKGLKVINKHLDHYINTDVKNDEKSDLQIFMHLSNHGFNQFGHIDIMFENKIYSYGNYDKKSQKLFSALGDGVLIEINENKIEYINFCINNSRKTVVEYGIRLTENQKKKIKKQINKIKNNTVDWVPPIISEKNKKSIYKDYASKIYRATGAKFYKFEKGEYKTYFVFGINCTYFVDKIIRNHILKIVGIITPGTYFEYLEENYKIKNSMVVFRKIYNTENIGDVYDKTKE